MVRNILAVLAGLIVGGLVNMSLVMAGPAIVPPPKLATDRKTLKPSPTQVISARMTARGNDSNSREREGVLARETCGKISARTGDAQRADLSCAASDRFITHSISKCNGD